ncbi:MAG TPA: hypothetical protein VHZ52_11690 [Acidobacteriaceae bacterium]|jgi:hypothetical protein|nr:hypothetical protein [Acidobacteriaceae bacterium]
MIAVLAQDRSLRAAQRPALMDWHDAASFFKKRGGLEIDLHFFYNFAIQSNPNETFAFHPNSSCP